MTCTLDSLKDDVIYEVDQMEPIQLTDPYIEDTIHEIADSSVPVYNHAIMEVASSDYSIMLDEPELGPAFDGSPTPVNIAASNIYSELCNAGYERLRERQEEEEEMGWEHEEALDEYEIVCEVREIMDAAAADWYATAA